MLSNSIESRNEILSSSQSQLEIIIANLALQLALVGEVNAASQLVSKLNKYDKLHSQTTILRPLWQLWDAVGSWPEGEEDQARECIKKQHKRSTEQEDDDDTQGDEDGKAVKRMKLDIDEKPITKEDIKKMVDRLAHEYSRGWWWPGKPGYGLTVEVDDANENATTSPYDRNISSQETVKLINGILSKYHTFEAERGDDEQSDPHSSIESLDMASAMVGALELRVRLGEDALTEEANLPDIESILKNIGRNLDGKGQISYLAESQWGWTVLKDGILAKVLGIDEKKLADFAKEVQSWVEERIQNGRQRETTDLSVRELLDMINFNTTTGEAAKHAYSEADEEPLESLFRDPATPEQIAEIESRLAIQLPKDYKEFLAISNGFGRGFGGILFEPPLHPCEDIRWFDDDEDYFIDLQLDIPNDVKFDGDEYENWPTVGKAIEIGTEDIDNIWLIPPKKISEVKAKVKSVLEGDESSENFKNSVRNATMEFAGSMEEWEQLEWCCLAWAAGGSATMIAYTSFKDYLSQLAVDSAKGQDEMLGHQKFFGYNLRKDEK